MKYIITQSTHPYTDKKEYVIIFNDELDFAWILGRGFTWEIISAGYFYIVKGKAITYKRSTLKVPFRFKKDSEILTDFINEGKSDD